MEIAERTKRPQPDARKEQVAETVVASGRSEAETAINRAGVSEDIDNQVLIEMNLLG